MIAIQTKTMSFAKASKMQVILAWAPPKTIRFPNPTWFKQVDTQEQTLKTKTLTNLFRSPQLKLQMIKYKALIIESKCLLCSNPKTSLNPHQWTKITVLSTRYNKQRKTTTTQSQPHCKTQQLQQQWTILIRMQLTRHRWCALMQVTGGKIWTSRIFIARS